ncbi:MAG: cobalamin B12-binding domain-containing protein [Deltaproteobacteria bacterium]|nr:cobalamin B12-binding domain-containing protein [Candidatus Desulfobacula maris]
MSKEDLIKMARRAVIEGDEELAVEMANKVIAEGINPVEIINEALSPAMTEVGDGFANEEISLPGVLVAADAMTKAIELLEPHIPVQEIAKKLGTVVIGTIEGDIHDIGKRIVATMLRVYGFEVHDLGRDVPIDVFVEKVRELKPDIVGTSSLMTTTMAGQKMLEEKLRKAGLRDNIKTMIGGAATTQEWANKIGCDCYAEDANDTVLKAKELIK